MLKHVLCRIVVKMGNDTFSVGCRWPDSMSQDWRLESNGMARVHLPRSEKSGTSNINTLPNNVMCVYVGIHWAPVKRVAFRLKAFPPDNQSINQSKAWGMLRERVCLHVWCPLPPSLP